MPKLSIEILTRQVVPWFATKNTRLATTCQSTVTHAHDLQTDTSTRDEAASTTSDSKLKRLTSVSWPPEPDPSIFTDPLRRDDPKPLRREELMRIDLRHLLSTTTLPRILRIVDSLPSPHARSNALTRLLGVDDVSLSKPGRATLVSQRDSPPPLETLLSALAGNATEETDTDMDQVGWWLVQEGTEGGRVWIGAEERRLMRIWAGVVCKAIDGDEKGEVEWGRGDLGWEV
ncbi:hypothetical protein TREMEDRAFT_61995 [Tremella mesenterica DSM 1558]|uniref:uncharacterized protein n=1 Tax=Tremella mesenterica (strain ATCC 24925 / CBS 8224 / DSM 1558 / NBRC 9311 / NRRL Y-6157 / RJB 2259-6 / UBC 559-6) TaxID=578456 RepID=UPI0003F492C6|nr:uncharacterized protein TREMEDRAFT_61995 [Tremella mesenterica DSM 1558]EIW70235.1 hypothetical protein TREMEDRAFT_61995 [Tremella mesenterica DSM 1558]